MESRSNMDRPATVTAALIGLVLIGVTIPYFLAGGAPRGTDYTIAWSQAEAGSKTGAVGASPTTLQVPVANVRVSNLTVEFDPCNDNTVQGLYGSVTISYRILQGTTEVPGGKGTATCANNGPFTIPVTGQPDIGSAPGGSADEAVKAAWGDAAGGNTTATYTLEVSSARGSSTVPITPPAGGPSFSATAKLTVQAWRATATAADQEVPR